MTIIPSYGGQGGFCYQIESPAFFAGMKELSWQDEDYTVHLYKEPTVYVENPANGWIHVVTATKTLRRAKKLARKATQAKLSGATTIEFCRGRIIPHELELTENGAEFLKATDSFTEARAYIRKLVDKINTGLGDTK